MESEWETLVTVKVKANHLVIPNSHCFDNCSQLKTKHLSQINTISQIKTVNFGGLNNEAI